jgi:UTP--glucose-1-phosphate uridylyltransferase
MVGDHLCVSRTDVSCARQLIECARQTDVCVSGVQATHESKLPVYGTVGGKLAGQQHGLYEVDRVIEKPTPTQAEQELIVPGLRAGHYLCFFGMHVLTPQVIELLGRQLEDTDSAGLSEVLKRLCGRERYLAYELDGNRYDIGSKYGLLNAQLALALSGRDRAEVLTLIVDLLAHQQSV